MYAINCTSFHLDYTLPKVDCQELFVEFIEIYVALFLLSVYYTAKGVITMSIADNIKRIRESHGMTQLEFAQIAGVSDKAVSTWENGLKIPRMGPIQKISTHFGITISEILSDDEKPLSVSAEGLSDIKRELIEKIYAMDDETVAALNRIADQVLSLRDK